MKKYIKRLYIAILITLMLVQNVFALSLIDKYDYQNEKYNTSKSLAINVINEPNTSQTIITDDGWYGYTYRKDYKYLISYDMLHEFNSWDVYIKTIKMTPNGNSISLEMKYLKHLEIEKSRYLRSGFKKLPKVHITTIKDDISYFNQLDNTKKPEISCVPTATTMMLHIGNFKELVPDDISQHVTFSSNGTTSPTVSSVLQKHYDVNTTYEQNIQLYKIKQNIINDTPMVAYIKSNHVDYYFRHKDESFNHSWDRMYHLKDKPDSYTSHAVLITGFLEIDGETHLEIYDPISVTTIWADAKPIPAGKGKYIKYNDFRKIENGPLVHFKIKHKNKS